MGTCLCPQLTKMYVPPKFIPLSQWTPVSLKVLAISLDVLHHAVLPCQLVVIRKVAYYPICVDM